MYPHERSLVKRLANQPFVLLGVNSDQDREELKEVMKQEGITWRSWWDGPQGPIATQWQIMGWPTLFVIDADGKIRFTSVGAGPFEEVVDKLLEEMAQQ
jgi:hypothetical protein